MVRDEVDDGRHHIPGEVRVRSGPLEPAGLARRCFRCIPHLRAEPEPPTLPALRPAKRESTDQPQLSSGRPSRSPSLNNELGRAVTRILKVRKRRGLTGRRVSRPRCFRRRESTCCERSRHRSRAGRAGCCRFPQLPPVRPLALGVALSKTNPGSHYLTKHRAPSRAPSWTCLLDLITACNPDNLNKQLEEEELPLAVTGPKVDLP